MMFRSDAPFHVKLEAFYHLTANISYPLMIVLSTLLMPAMIIRFYQGWFQMLLIDVPLFHGVDIFPSPRFTWFRNESFFPADGTRRFCICPFSWLSE